MVALSPHSPQTYVSTPTNGAECVEIQAGNGASPKDNVAGKRRVSARLQAAAKRKAEKMELLSKRKLELVDEDGERSSKKLIVDTNKLKQKLKPQHARTGIQLLIEIPFNPAEPKISKKVAKMVERASKISEGLDGINTLNVVEKSSHIKVKETEEEKRCGVVKVANKAGKKAARANKAAKANKARMMERKAVLYPQKRIGNIPGIDVGHQFYSRAEMVAVGFHSHWLNGIDFMGQSYRKGEYKHYKFPLAVAIVLSGMYEDDLDNAEDVVYTGQGGHDLTGSNKRQIRDQVLTRGNLALKNCHDLGVTVRVVRGHECTSSYSGKVYTYDGLYKCLVLPCKTISFQIDLSLVLCILIMQGFNRTLCISTPTPHLQVEKYWAEKGLSGFTVFKYRLRRLEGQPTLTTSQVQFAHGRVPQCTSEIRGLVCEDISGGQENVPIPATNLVDDPPVAPTG
ncbi:N-alpha-acetyltransferase MAK3-like isoform X1 [Hibiscus syriacus]|uniref:N-alpha-acetyltransferase MAK3-like isoform X1 n=1 Tax=Hibiscus syriacus TaxID=106335 RepID=A0A6A2YD22_HIBSY|nr:N-alpha-acetyltransferase MAK3-like isoform X1 [Hibiscus syriacus]